MVVGAESPWGRVQKVAAVAGPHEVIDDLVKVVNSLDEGGPRMICSENTREDYILYIQLWTSIVGTDVDDDLL